MKLLLKILEAVPIELLILLVLLTLLKVFLSSGSSSAKKLTNNNARLSGKREISKALSTAQKQAENQKIDQTALFIGGLQTGWKPHLDVYLGKKNKIIPLPHLQRSLIAFGTPNAGKTTTIVKPLVKDIIERNLGSIIFFDPKSDLAPVFAPFSEAHGYKNYFIAPGREYTDSINFYDFLDRKDWLSSVAEQMAQTTIRNTKQSNEGSTDPFFGQSGVALLRSVLMLTKLTFPEPNLVTTKELLAVPDLIDRLRYAEERNKISPWVSSSLRQFMSGESSEKTIASIQSTASLVFDGFIRPEFINTYANPTSIPLDLTEKQMIFIQPMRGFEDVCMPMLSAFTDLIIERNFAKPRSKPLFLVIDELHLMYLPRLSRWLAFLRSSGLVMILSTQAVSQIKGAYGENEFDTIYNSTGTKIIMNPDDSSTANLTSNRLGEKEISYQQTGYSYARSGSSRSRNEQFKKVPLISAQKINKMNVGEFICWNWGFESKGETGIPLHIKYKVPDDVFDFDEQCEKVWETTYLERLKFRAKDKHKTQEESEAFLIAKTKEVAELLPSRPESIPNKAETEKDKISNSDIHNLKPQETGILKNNHNAIPLP